MIPEDATSVAKYMFRVKSIVGGDYYFVTNELCQIFFGFRAFLYYLTSGKNFMVISPAVPEILGGVVFHPPSDAIKLSKRADAIIVKQRLILIILY